VPVVRRLATRKGVLQIAQETAGLAAKAREGKLTRRRWQGGSMSISSLGGIGARAFTPIHQCRPRVASSASPGARGSRSGRHAVRGPADEVPAVSVLQTRVDRTVPTKRPVSRIGREDMRRADALTAAEARHHGDPGSESPGHRRFQGRRPSSRCSSRPDQVKAEDPHSSPSSRQATMTSVARGAGSIKSARSRSGDRSARAA